jgi:hypothetical protein
MQRVPCIFDEAQAPGRPREEVRIVEGKPTSAWLIVMTKGCREYGARDQLQSQQFEVYLPLRLLDAATARRRGVSAAPLFPRILFARATLDADRWQAIFSTYGVQRVLCDPKRPRGIKSEFVEGLRAREIDGFLKLGLKDPSRPAPPPPPKDPRRWVKLNEVIDGLCGETLDANRGSVLVSLLNEGRAALTQDIRRW